MNAPGGGPFTNMLTSTWPITQQNHSLRIFPICFCFILLSLTSVFSALEISGHVYVKTLTWHSLYNKRRQRKKNLLTAQEPYNKRQQGIRKTSETERQPSRAKFSWLGREKQLKWNTGKKQGSKKKFKVYFIKYTSMSCIVLSYIYIISEIFILKGSC